MAMRSHLEAVPGSAEQQASVRSDLSLPGIGCCDLSQLAALPGLPSPTFLKDVIRLWSVRDRWQANPPISRLSRDLAPSVYQLAPVN